MKARLGRVVGQSGTQKPTDQDLKTCTSFRAKSKLIAMLKGSEKIILRSGKSCQSQDDDTSSSAASSRPSEQKLGHQAKVVRGESLTRKSAKVQNLFSGQKVQPRDELQVAFDPLPVELREHRRVEDVVDRVVAVGSIRAHLFGRSKKFI